MDIDSLSVVPDTPEPDDNGSIAGLSGRETAKPSEGSGATPTSAEFPGKDGPHASSPGDNSTAEYLQGHAVVRELVLDGQEEEVAGSGEGLASTRQNVRNGEETACHGG